MSSAFGCSYSRPRGSLASAGTNSDTHPIGDGHHRATTATAMTHQQRRVAPVECPLASLGRNTPSMDTRQYHHPLSSSPLDPQAYQMSRSSPILTLDSDLYPSDCGKPDQGPPDGLAPDGGGGGSGGGANGNGSLLSRSSSSSLDQTGSFLRQALPLPLHPPPTNGQQLF